MKSQTIVLLLAIVLTGCSDKPATGETCEDCDLFGDVPPSAVRGVVVDGAIVPVADATVRIPSLSLESTTDETGRFLFLDVPVGTYFLNVSKLNFAATQVAVTVGDETPLVKVQLLRLFDQTAYLVGEQFQGFITCGFDVNFASSLCLNDFTRFAPGSDGVAPQLQETGLDDRDHDYIIEKGWQTHIVEMVWEPSADSTSENMAGFISHFPRPATHRYASGGGPSPVLVRMQMGETHEFSQDEPEQVPPEGLPNMHFFAAVDTDSNQGPPYSTAAVTVQQDFEAFFHTFYYGVPPEGWSFIGGDSNPF